MAEECPDPVESAGDPSPSASDKVTRPSPAKPRWRRVAECAALILIGGIVLVVVLVRIIERRNLYHPTKFPGGDWDAPTRAGAECEDVFIEAADGVRLHGWFLRAAGGSDGTDAARVTVLFFHGNAGNVSHTWSWLRTLSRLPADVFAIDYRGYGRSEGSPSEEGIYLDAEAAYRYLTESRGVPPGRIIVYGKSLGGAPACEIASRFECGGLVLQSTFTNTPDMSGQIVPFVPLGWAMGTEFDNEGKLPSVSAPLLVIHSRVDEVVPYRLGERLFAVAKEPKEFVRLERSIHNDLPPDEAALVIEKLKGLCKRIAP